VPAGTREAQRRERLREPVKAFDCVVNSLAFPLDLELLRCCHVEKCLL
jgi:hypothetical protein